MLRVQVPIPRAAYEVTVGRGVFRALPAALERLEPSAVALVGDRRLAGPMTALAKALTRRGLRVETHALVSTEAAKDYRRLFPLFGALIAAGFDRRSVLVAVGGGVVGDAVGFLAATFLRGIRWVGVPTTLLAQVDSCVGGKTGVNHPLGKNLIGAFHQPSLVVADVAFLGTLSRRDLVSGYGEMVKYGLAYDSRLLRALLDRQQAVLALRSPWIEQGIAASLRHKARVVAADERETKGKRQVLNLGHTIGHALETLTGYTSLRHGEAVLYGLRAALALSVVRGHLRRSVQAPLDEHLAALPMPSLPRLSLERLWTAVLRDKKAEAGRVRFVLLAGVGKPVADMGVGKADLAQALDLLGWERRR